MERVISTSKKVAKAATLRNPIAGQTLMNLSDIDRSASVSSRSTAKSSNSFNWSGLSVSQSAAVQRRVLGLSSDL